MTGRLCRRDWIKWIVWGLTGCATPGCGTLLYPERRGQPAGRLDWRVVLLDGIGLFFFFIPGVIAFAVDFLNGTIYLPAEGVDCEPPQQSSTSSPPALRKITLSRSELTPRGIERRVSREIGKPVSLEEGDCMICEMDSIDRFWEQAGRLKRSWRKTERRAEQRSVSSCHASSSLNSPRDSITPFGTATPRS